MPLLAVPPPPPAITARAAVLIDGDTGQILYSRNAHQHLPQASTTKLMTALVAVEQGRLNTLVTIASRSAETAGSSMYLETGEKLSLEQLLYGLLLVSGNDAADAIATEIGGSTEGFVQRMNARAAAMGLKDTHYANPHGLPDPAHYSSAADLATIARIALANSAVARIADTRTLDLPGNNRIEKRHLVNHNKLLGWFPGAWGGKTGYTAVAGRCFVGSARRDGRYVIEAILDSTHLWQDAASLLNYGIDAFQTTQVGAPNATFGSVTIRDGEALTVAAILRRAALVTLPAQEATTALTNRVELNDGVDAPVRLGERVGRLIISKEGRDIATFPLISSASVERAPSLLERLAGATVWFLSGGFLSLGLFSLLRFRQLRRRAKMRARRARTAALVESTRTPVLVKAGR